MRKQLALFLERNAKPRRTTPMFRLVMVALARLFDWRKALPTPSSAGIGRASGCSGVGSRDVEVDRHYPRTSDSLIREMGTANPTWGEGRIADKLSLKLGVFVSPRTVSKYLVGLRPPEGSNGQRWSTFLRLRNHAAAAVACDFFQSVTLDFEVLYVFIAMEIGSRRIIHTNVTAHPSAEWTIQQFREMLPFDHPYYFLIHDRDAIFSRDVDAMC